MNSVFDINSTFVWFYGVSLLLLLAVVSAFVVGVASLIATIVRWKSPNRRRHVRRVLISLATIPVLVGTQQAVQWRVFVPALGRQRIERINATRSERLADTSVVKVGDVAPQFSVMTATGDEFSFPANGQVVLINFFATWCGPCQAELPHIEKIWKRLQANENFRLLVVGAGESSETVLEYRDKSGFSFPIAADPDRQIFSLFAEKSIPRTLIISPKGRIVYSKLGFMEQDVVELTRMLEQHLNDTR